MRSDGNLRRIFQQHVPEAHWQAIESWSTGQGVPDANYCLSGCEGWIEMKQTSGWRVKLEPHQVAWIERRSRAGGRVLVAVRRQVPAGPRRGEAVDQLWMFPARVARQLVVGRIDETDMARPWTWGGGPANWDWNDIRRLLQS